MHDPEEILLMRRLQDSIILKQLDTITRSTYKLKSTVFFKLRLNHYQHKVMSLKYFPPFEKLDQSLRKIEIRKSFMEIFKYNNHIQMGSNVIQKLLEMNQIKIQRKVINTLQMHSFCKMMQSKQLSSIDTIVEEILMKKKFLSKNTKKYKRELFYYHFSFRKHFEIKSRCFEAMKSLRNRADLHAKVLLKKKTEKLEQKSKKLKKAIEKLEGKLKSTYNSIYQSIGCKATFDKSGDSSRDRVNFNLYDKKSTKSRKHKLSLNTYKVRGNVLSSQEKYKQANIKNMSVDGKNKFRNYTKQKEGKASSEVGKEEHTQMMERKEFDLGVKNFIYKKSFTELYNNANQEVNEDMNIINSSMNDSIDILSKSKQADSNNMDSPCFSKKILKIKENRVTGSLKKMHIHSKGMIEKDEEERRIYSIGGKKGYTKEPNMQGSPLRIDGNMKQKTKWCSLKNSIRDIGMKGITENQSLNKNEKKEEKSLNINQENHLEITLGRQSKNQAEQIEESMNQNEKNSQNTNPFLKSPLKTSNASKDGKPNPFINTNESNETPLALVSPIRDDSKLTSPEYKDSPNQASLGKNSQLSIPLDDKIIKLNINSNKRINKKKSKSLITKPLGGEMPRSGFAKYGSFSNVPDTEEEGKNVNLQRMIELDLKKLNDKEILQLMELLKGVSKE